MARLTLMRTDSAPPTEQEQATLRQFLFGYISGFTEPDKRAWNRFWRRVLRMEPGEMFEAEWAHPRSGPFHRRHMKIEQSVFDAQERFDDFKQFRYWLKVGAAWVTWAAGPKGGVVPIPRSVSYRAADEDTFREFHQQVISFLRGPHAATYLWPHLAKLGQADAMMNSILEGFSE